MRSDVLAAADHARAGISAGLRCVEHEKQVALEVRQPDLGHACRRVAWHLDGAIQRERGVGDLDDQERVGWTWPARRVVVVAAPKYGHIRLELLAYAEHHRVLDGHESAHSQALREQIRQPNHTRGMTRADRAHRDDLAIDELEALVGSEEARLDEAVVLVDREEASLDLNCH